MIATHKIRGLMAENGVTQEILSEKIGISSKTFGLKMKKGVFNSDEMQVMVDVLNIKNPAEIFFARLSPDAWQKYISQAYPNLPQKKKNARRGLRTLSPVFVYLKLNAEIKKIRGSMVWTLFSVSRKRNPPFCFLLSKITYAERDCKCLCADSIICCLQERAHSKILTMCHHPFLRHSAKNIISDNF